MPFLAFPFSHHNQGQLQDATTFFKHMAASRTESHVQQVLQAQITCELFPNDAQIIRITLVADSSCESGSSWSSQIDFGITPDSLTDGSLLAVGTRAGSVMFLR